MSEDPHQAFILTEAGPSPPGGERGRRRARGPGDLVAGKYVLVRYLARGGMAEVWLGKHASLKTDVAIKFVDTQLASDRDTGPYTLERFRFEAQIAAQLGARTPRVVTVQDAGTHDGAPYLVMEYVPGRTLEAAVEAGGPMAPARFAMLLDQVADALDAAHALGIIHRDLKPSNLLLCEETEDRISVKVADFGVAKVLRTTLALDRPRETQEGQLVGSPAFMSPEQLRGLPDIDGRSDLWSLGVVAYETLTGQSCFEGMTVLDLFATITARRFRTASIVRPGLPPGIDAWMNRALALQPEDRFATAGEMARAFRLLLAPPSRASRVPLAAAALLAVAALSAVLIVLVRAEAAPRAAVAAGTSAAVTAVSPPSAVPVAAPTGPAPINVAALPPPVETGHTGRRPLPSARPSATPVVTAAPTPTPAPVVTAAVTATAVAPPPPTAPPATRTHKGIDPSEIQ